MQTIALVDPFWSGHHSTYLKRYSEALLQLGHRVIVFCPEPAALADLLDCALGQARDNWQAINYGWTPDPIKPSRLRLRAAALERLGRLAQLLSQIERALATPFDLVFFPLLDEFIGRYQTGFDFDYRLKRTFSGVYFRPGHLRLPVRYPSLRRGPLNPDAALESKFCRAVAVLDENVASRLSARLGGKLVLPFPDITDERVDALPTELEQNVRAKARGRKIIGLIGSLDKRKGLLTLIQHARALQTQPFFFILAGQVVESSFTPAENAWIADCLDNPPDNIFAIRGFIEDGPVFNSLVRCCDLLYAVYQNFPYSSNLLTKAALLRTPIAVAARYLMAERVERYHLGFVVREDAPEDFRALLNFDPLLALRATTQFQTGCRAYLEAHSFQQLSKCFEKILDR